MVKRKVGLDRKEGKYGRIFYKRKNVPIVMLGNLINTHPDAFQTAAFEAKEARIYSKIY